MKFQALITALFAVGLTFATTAFALPIADVTNPGDFIIAIDLDGGSGYPGTETPQNAIDNTLAKYLNFGGPNSGFIVTPSNNPSNYAVDSFTITTANDVPGRDPSSYALYGTNATILSTDNSTGGAEPWTLITSGVLSLPAARDTIGPTVNFSNLVHYDSFRMVFPTLSGDSLMQFAEIQFGASELPIPAPEPGTLMLAFAGAALVVRRKRRSGRYNQRNAQTECAGYVKHRARYPRQPNHTPGRN